MQHPDWQFYINTVQYRRTFFPLGCRTHTNEQKLRCTTRYLRGEAYEFCWTLVKFSWSRLSAETLTTCSGVRAMGEYSISLQSQKSPKSPAWIFDERCVGWPIAKRHLFPILLTGQPSPRLASADQKQMFHGWNSPFRRITDLAVMHIWKISAAACWECIGIYNLIRTRHSLVKSTKSTDKVTKDAAYFCIHPVWAPTSLPEHTVHWLAILGHKCALLQPPRPCLCHSNITVFSKFLRSLLRPWGFPSSGRYYITLIMQKHGGICDDRSGLGSPSEPYYDSLPFKQSNSSTASSA